MSDGFQSGQPITLTFFAPSWRTPWLRIKWVCKWRCWRRATRRFYVTGTTDSYITVKP